MPTLIIPRKCLIYSCIIYKGMDTYTLPIGLCGIPCLYKIAGKNSEGKQLNAP
nr:MAG TPA: hypothetical protein [Caudoviricetes sp.]